jgi:hypothetical protein
MTFFTEIEKILKFIWKHKRCQISKTVLTKQDTAGGITTFDLKLDYRPIVTKTGT